MIGTHDSGASGPGSSPGDIVLWCWGRHFTATVSLSTQVYKWVLANLMLGVIVRLTSIPSRGSRNTPSRPMQLKPRSAVKWAGLFESRLTLRQG